MASRGNREALYVETSNLHLELRAALKEDVCRKKTDEMKKRAIHTAASYDEFRHMVSCAHLTPVTRKDMEMLSDQKRGWQGRSGGVVSAKKKEGSFDRKRVPRSMRNSGAATLHGAGVKTEPLRPPEDHSQFQREWRRRCRTEGERRKYLRLIGPEKVSVLFRVEMEPDVLAQMLSSICQDFPASSRQEPVPGAGREYLIERCTGTPDREASLGEAHATKCMEWLRALTKTGRFAVNIMFLKDKEKLALRNVFDLMTASFGDKSDENYRRLEALRQAYVV